MEEVSFFKTWVVCEFSREDSITPLIYPQDGRFLNSAAMTQYCRLWIFINNGNDFSHFFVVVSGTHPAVLQASDSMLRNHSWRGLEGQQWVQGGSKKRRERPLSNLYLFISSLYPNQQRSWGPLELFDLSPWGHEFYCSGFQLPLKDPTSKYHHSQMWIRHQPRTFVLLSNPL